MPLPDGSWFNQVRGLLQYDFWNQRRHLVGVAPLLNSTKVANVQVLDRFNISRMFFTSEDESGEYSCLCSQFYLEHNLPAFLLLPGAKSIGTDTLNGTIVELWEQRSGPIITTVSLSLTSPRVPLRIVVHPDPVAKKSKEVEIIFLLHNVEIKSSFQEDDFSQPCDCDPPPNPYKTYGECPQPLDPLCQCIDTRLTPFCNVSYPVSGSLYNVTGILIYIPSSSLPLLLSLLPSSTHPSTFLLHQLLPIPFIS
eukprot:TRINITY_DN12051_c0_g1_i6.p1 TRINITY_DN12051_c0_g1~~TRINITY_DN12051_c0_g1_i6.p1  ORF type:complete len:289 (+),score=56.74 TRINITY_DN12051_c0_g1_i6:114-869(+)